MAIRYKQRKYCEDCGVYFFYDDVGAPDATEVCPIDAGHTTRDHVTKKCECASCNIVITNQ